MRQLPAWQDVPRFYMYTGDALDFSWMASACPGFETLRRTAYNERLGEVDAAHVVVRRSALSVCV